MSSAHDTKGTVRPESRNNTALNNIPASDSVDAAARRAFGSTTQYLQAELEASGSDLGLLEKLNDASIAKYEGLSRQAQDMLVHAYKIKQTYNEMTSQIAQVDIKGDALELSAKFMDLFIKEAIERAKAKRAESSDAHKPVDESDLEKILAQLLLDL
ncbi:hypothetical protein GGH96_005032 [Coemansia sp. RSA 1972]|nr:hypothetical protein GGH96_005032 [Coemansia sp. RSA 1972]